MPRAEHAGGALRTRLLALVLIPLLGVGILAAGAISSRVHTASGAHRAQRLIDTAVELTQVRSRILDELVPSLTRSIGRAPALALALGLTSGLPAQLDRIVAEVDTLRQRTDRALTRLAANPLESRLAASVRTDLSRMRSDIDSESRVTDGGDMANALVAKLTTATRAAGSAAIATGVSGPVQLAVRDLERVIQLVRFGDEELPQLAGNMFRTPDGPRPTAAPPQWWLTAWGGYRIAYADLTARRDTPLARALVAAASIPAARRFDTTMAQVATDPSRADAARLVALAQESDQRSAALGRVLELAVHQATAATAAERHRAAVALWTIAGLTLGLLLVCLLIGLRVLRSISAPLRGLAASARKVSEGVLDPVPVQGPEEVRTVARGLASAVANLRNIEAQAAAVAAGDLEGDVLREPLPGPLGQVVHDSVETIIGAIHERDNAQRDLSYRAAHDSLTGLVNRAQAIATIERALHRAQRAGAMTALMFVDLDHFKKVNDTFGHEAGDAVLVACAQRMAHVVRGGDTVARLGGDEFVILLENVVDESDPMVLADRVVAALAEPIHYGDGDVHVGASVGLAISADGGVDAEQLLGEADTATYHAKQTGRGRVGFFDEGLRAELARRTELDAAIAEGLRNGEFELYYQPLVNLPSGQPRGAEALIRWHRPGHGLVSPDEFIPTAEQSRRINDIGRWALRAALSQLARWDAETGNTTLTVGVNISGRHLSSTELLPDVQGALAEAGLPAHRLVIEVTETVLVSDPLATRNLTALRAMGVVVALDDFGTGFTSIRQLRFLPVDSIKIDRSFVASDDPANQELVRLLATAAHTFGVRVVAEGVEEQADLATPLECGIAVAQGYYFARPAPAPVALEMLRAARLPLPAPVVDRGEGTGAAVLR